MADNLPTHHWQRTSPKDGHRPADASVRGPTCRGAADSGAGDLRASAGCRPSQNLPRASPADTGPSNELLYATVLEVPVLTPTPFASSVRPMTHAIQFFRH